MNGPSAAGRIRTVLGDRDPANSGLVYAHEHLIIDSPLIAAAFPHIHLHDTDAAVAELAPCAAAGVGTVIDAMPCSAGRRVTLLAEIAERTGVDVVVATGLHHDRYYGPAHWTNRVDAATLAELFIADLIDGVDEFDYTAPVVRRTAHRAGFVKVATSGASPDARDERNLEAAARASVATGAPVLTHCEAGWGAVAQVERLSAWGVPPEAILLSHVDKTRDLGYLRDVAGSGAVLEFDQSLRDAALGADSFTVQSIATLTAEGFGDRIVVGTDGARRSLWTSLGGGPGLGWLAVTLPPLLAEVGLDAASVDRIMGGNAAAAISWRAAS